MNIYIVSIVNLVFLFFGCVERTKDQGVKFIHENENVQTIDFVEGLGAKNIPNLYDNIESMEYIMPELTDESMIGEYTKVIVADDKLFIMESSVNNQSVFIFDLTGQFLSKINAVGQGPGEYVEIHDFYYDDQSDLVGILSMSRIYRYNLDGTFYDSTNLWEYMINKIAYANGRIYAYTTPLGMSSMCNYLSVFDGEFNLVYQDYLLPRKLNSFPLCSDKMFFFSNQKEIFLNALNSDTIYRIGNNYLRPEYILNFGQYKYPDDEFDKLIETEKKVIQNLDEIFNSSYLIFGVHDYLITDEYIYTTLSKDRRLFYSFYSFNSKTNKVFYKGMLDTATMPFMSVKAVYNNKFYANIDPQMIRYHKDRDEIEGVPELPDEHPRKIRYNKVLKNYNPDNNDLIAVFTIKPF